MKYFRAFKGGVISKVWEVTEDEAKKLKKCYPYAQFVDGECICNGDLSDEEVVEAKKKYLCRL